MMRLNFRFLGSQGRWARGRRRAYWGLACLALVGALMVRLASVSWSATTMKRYYAHDAVADKYGVIAPWYKGLNGQCDYRVRIAAETMKRYPWVDASKAAAAAPEYVWNGSWQISDTGVIKPGNQSDWTDGDRLQRCSFVIRSLADYYRYTGDAWAIGVIGITADVIANHSETDASHPWPKFPITVPVKGKLYGNCDPGGMIQLDIAAEAGYALLKAYEITGNDKYLNTAKHWGDLLAARRNLDPKAMPWQRYANPENAPWGQNPVNGNVAYILYFMDELIRVGHTGENGAIVKARDAGRAYLRDKVLPLWLAKDSWGRNFWDWDCSAMCEYSTNWPCRYMMDNKDYFPNWRTDVRNILALYANRTSVDASSSSEVYNGAWQFPESPGCCGRSLWYGSMELAWIFSQYAADANSEWAREIARRQQIMATYDIRETGVSEDNIDGGFIVANGWFKIAHPMALIHALGTIGCLPEELGASRENHIVRSTATITSVKSGDGVIRYSVFDAPPNTTEVLRLAFTPSSVRVRCAPEAGYRPLKRRRDLKANGYTIKPLKNGDCIVAIRHDGATMVDINGRDPRESAEAGKLSYEGSWASTKQFCPTGKLPRMSGAQGAAVSYKFKGNQVRVIGNYAPDGGRADVYVDEVKQLAGIDCWNPTKRDCELLYYKNGLTNGEHTVKVVVLGAKNPYSKGTNVYVDSVQWSVAEGISGFGSGAGPTGAQRFIFGYPERKDYVDSHGNGWRPGMEYIVRLGGLADVVAKSWWTEPVKDEIVNTKDSTLYRYGIHGGGLVVNTTVGPGKYHARLKFAATRGIDTDKNCMSIAINGERMVSNMDVAATAGGANRAVDLVFNNLKPRNGVIEVRLMGGNTDFGLCGDAFIQALEVGPGDGGKGATPVTAKSAAGVVNLLNNPGFEEGVTSQWATSGTIGISNDWKCVFHGPGMTYATSETDARIRPNHPRPEMHCGNQALRTHTDGNGHVTIYQEVVAKPKTKYTAWVWVRAVNKAGKGFGASPGDSAGFFVEELDASGAVLAAHKKVTISKPQPYGKLEYAFTSGEKTAKVRFNLETVITGNSKEGSVTYDDCVLVAE